MSNLSSYGIPKKVINLLSDKAKQALELIQSRAATTGGFVTFEYKTNSGDTNKYQVRFGADYAKHYKASTSKKKNWVSKARKYGVKNGVLLFKNRVYVMGTEVNGVKNEGNRAIRTMKVESIANMISGQSVMDQMEKQSIQWDNERMDREVAGHPGF